jgi:hypothetical protein
LTNSTQLGSNNISLAWDTAQKIDASSGCAQIDHYELEVKVGNEPWKDLIDPEMEY